MGWTALPPVDWWIVIGGVLWFIFWVTVVVMVSTSLASAFLHLTDRGQRLEADPLQLAEKRHARGEISREGFQDVRGDLGGTSSPDRVGR
jgi:uncharacterized membrane protein